VAKYPLYQVWYDMKRRCENPSRHDFERYGGRGIKVCEEWSKSFSVFRDWSIKNNWEPGLTIERINNGFGYGPTNCKYTTRTEQNRNHPNTKLTMNDAQNIRSDPRSYRQIAKDYGVTYNNVGAIKRGLTWQSVL
jgi:hypothetical protein